MSLKLGRCSYCNISNIETFMSAVFVDCYKVSTPKIWIMPEVVLMLTGLIANIVLLYLFLKERKSLTASKVLGVNLVMMDILYLLLMPVNVYADVYNQTLYGNNSAATDDIDNSFANPLNRAADSISIINLIGCALLLACMCVERYVAVSRPVLYLRLRRLEYRAAVSAVVWTITMFCSLVTSHTGGLYALMVPICIIMSSLFLLMLAALGGVVWSLWQTSPAHSRSQAAPLAPLKRRAVENVLAVVVPAVVSYLPILFLVPMLTIIQNTNREVTPTICSVLRWMFFFPKFALFIGPMFYLAKARQVLCISGGGKATKRKLFFFLNTT